MGRRFNTHVTIGGETFGPDDDVPDDIAAKITNQAVWADNDGDGAPVPPRDAPANLVNRPPTTGPGEPTQLVAPRGSGELSPGTAKTRKPRDQ